ncbi:MAG: hypothetical protein KTR31_33675 [Myxococcales bacterium]|nr:hypothetical protein [Myxococcales bacterium]
MRRSVLTVLIAVSLSTSGCGTKHLPDDAGNDAFIAWATVAILGRRPYSHGEVAALRRLASLRGREAVVDVLMAQPEFVPYWTRLLFEDQHVAKERGGLSFGEMALDTTCFEEEVLHGYYDDDLVAHLVSSSTRERFCPPSEPPNPDSILLSAGATRTVGALAYDAIELQERFSRDTLLAGSGNQPGPAVVSPMWGIDPGGFEYLDITYTGQLDGVSHTEAPDLPLAIEPCNSFTMADVARAALREDRLDVLYRAGLIPLATMNFSRGITAGKFMDGWIDRDPSCVQCHTTHYSTTNPSPRNNHWDRYFPAFDAVDLEGTAFSWEADEGFQYGGDGGGVDPETGNLRAYDNIAGFFRGDAWLESPNGVLPWGMHESCVYQSYSGDVRRSLVADLDDGGFATLGGIWGTQLGPLQLADMFGVGVSHLAQGMIPVEGSPVPQVELAKGGPQPQATWDGCVGGCHAPGSDVAPTAPKNLEAHIYEMTPQRVFDIVVNGSPAGDMRPEGDEAVANAIVEHMRTDLDHYHNKFYVQRAAAVAHLTAQSVVNNIFEHMTGASLTIDHRFPRTKAASDELRTLTASFVAHDWSLREVIKRVALSDYMNGLAPDDADGPAYVLPMVFEPWANVEGNGPSITMAPMDDANGQGDVVHRWPVPSLLLQLHHALFWPEPPLYPTDDADSYIDIDFYKEIGGRVNWNDRGSEDLGITALLAWELEVDRCQNPGPGEDYIDVLSDPEHGLDMAEAMEALKGRLTTDHHIDYDGEEGVVIQEAFGVDWSADASSGVQSLRDYCAALLRSPQFLMSGLPAWPDGAGELQPPAAVPCVDERCGTKEHCEHYRELALDLGYETFSCGVVLVDEEALP